MLLYFSGRNSVIDSRILEGFIWYLVFPTGIASDIFQKGWLNVTFCGTFFGPFYFLKLLDLWDLFWYRFLYYFQEGEGKADDRMGGDGDIPSISAMNSLDSPMTPCPSAVEYVTPVFAKNYQGVWRYVVQIPYEGYFTQTVEVVKCL